MGVVGIYIQQNHIFMHLCAHIYTHLCPVECLVFCKNITFGLIYYLKILFFILKCKLPPFRLVKDK